MKQRLTNSYQLLTTYLRLRKTSFSDSVKKDIFKAFRSCDKMIAQKKAPVACKIGNYTMKAPDPVVLKLLIREILINEEYYIELDNNKPVVIDCGSNLGFSILYFKIKYPEAIITGIEANPATFEILKENVAQFNNVTVYNRFVSNASDQTMELYTYGAGDVAASHNAARGNGEKNIIQSIALKELIGDKKVDLLKMDIEGGEYFIFNQKEQPEYIRHVEYVLLEYHHIFENGKAVNSFADFLTVFEKNNFMYTISAAAEPTRKYQDIHLVMKRI